MIQQYQLLTILTTILIANVHNTPTLFQAPKFLQASQFQITGNWTSISSGTNYDIPYRDGFTIAGSGIGCIVMTSFSMSSKADVLFNCRTVNIGGSSIRVQCTANDQTFISLFTFSYLVADSTQYNTAIKTIILSQNSISLTNEVGLISKTINMAQNTPSHKYKCFIYLRGMEYKNTLKNYSMNQTCDEINGQYFIKLSVLKQVQQSTLHYSIVALNTYQLIINNNYFILSHVQIYKNNGPITSITTPFTNKTQVSFFAGLKSISIQSTANYSSLSLFSNVSVLYSFDQNSTYNEIQIMYLTYLKCTTTTDFIDKIHFQCRNMRNGCTQYYQTITFTIPPTSNFRAANVHSSYKIISYNQAGYIKLLRYNGTQFIPYYQIPDPSGTGIVDFQMSEDYSRVAFIAYSTALFIYAWNGTDYIEQFKYSGQMGQSRQFISFDTTSDFKTIALLSILTTNSNNILSTLIYNEVTKTYSINQSIMPTGVVKVFVRNDGKSAYIFSNKYFYHMTLSLPLGRYVSDYDIIYIEQSSILVDIAVAIHSQKIAIEYFRKNPGLTQTTFGIKILQFDINQKKWIITRISPQIFTPFSNNFHRIIFSKHGRELILKPISGSYLAIFNKTSGVVGDPYKISQVIGKVPGSVYTGTINNYALAVSPGLQFILSGDTRDSFVLYYCRSIINRPNRTYEIPKAQPLSKPIIIIPTPVDPIPQQNNNQEIEQLSDQLTKSETVSKVMLALGIVSLSGIIVLSLYLLYQKLQSTSSSSALNTQLDINNPTRTNLDLQQNDQINNFSSLHD